MVTLFALVPVETNKLLLVGVSSQLAALHHGVRTQPVLPAGKGKEHKNMTTIGAFGPHL